MKKHDNFTYKPRKGSIGAVFRIVTLVLKPLLFLDYLTTTQQTPTNVKKTVAKPGTA